MRIVLALLLTALTLSVPVLADEREGELDRLFAQLGAAGSPAEAAPLETAIWDAWIYAGDSNTDEMMDRGILAMESGALALAEGIFSSIVTALPSLSEGWNKRATVFYLMGDLDASVRDIQKTLELEPRHFGALSGLGLIYIETEQYPAAIRAFDRALEIHPQQPLIRAQEKILRDKLKGSEI